MKVEIRCERPHPVVKGWSCRAKLNIAVPDGFEVREGAAPDLRCVTVTCWRCGATYEVCPVGRAA